MTITQEERLTKLATHLLNGGSHLGKWNFNVFVDIKDVSRQRFIDSLPSNLRPMEARIDWVGDRTHKIIPTKSLCGTVGCAIGEGALVFPNKFKITISSRAEMEVVVKVPDGWCEVSMEPGIENINEFFGIYNQFDNTMLFCPVGNGYPKTKGEGKHRIRQLGSKATMQAVGKNLMKYIEGTKAGAYIL